MAEYITTVTQKGQVTIPGELRKVLGLRPKDKVAFELVADEVRLRPVKSPVLASYGSVKPLKASDKPTDYKRLRSEIEEEIADEVAGEV